MTVLAGKMLGQYQIIEEIGRGGMAVVYRAYQPSLNRYVAIKVLPPQFTFDTTFVQRFLREARAAARLEHPNIVTTHDVGELVLGHSRLTWLGVVLGTLRYMAPEQVRGGDVGGWTDIYALAVTCYELLTGQPAFTGKTVEIAAKIVNGQYRLPSQSNPMLPPAVDNVIWKAMQIDPRQRYQSAAQFSHALRGSLGIGEISPTPLPRREVRTPTGQADASITPLIIICIVTIVLVIMFLMVLMKGRQ